MNLLKFLISASLLVRTFLFLHELFRLFFGMVLAKVDEVSASLESGTLWPISRLAFMKNLWQSAANANPFCRRSSAHLSSKRAVAIVVLSFGFTVALNTRSNHRCRGIQEQGVESESSMDTLKEQQNSPPPPPHPDDHVPLNGFTRPFRHPSTTVERIAIRLRPPRPGDPEFSPC
jgi:hypothetical protein